MANTAENKWAVLIGVDHYIKGPSREGLTFHNLEGCVEDVNQVYEYLSMSLGVHDSHITRLTATIPDENGSEPTEVPSQWPTYENIVNTLQKVSEKAKPKDLVYLHYSGHGARVTTIFEDLKGDGSLDEALVPTNIHRGEGRYIRDVEIAYLLQEMVKKELVVTVVLDCCHSGGADRNALLGDAKIRGIARIDTNKLDSDVSVFSHNDLKNAMKSPVLGAERKATVANHWLLESRGYAFLAACRPHEKALEIRYGHKIQGVLTRSLIDTLKENSNDIPYYRLWELVALKVLKQSKQQNVVFGGEGDRLFYSEDRLKLFYAATVVDVVSNGEGKATAQLNAGEAHGISKDMQLGVWPPLCTDFSDTRRIGHLHVLEAKQVTSEARFIPSTPKQQIQVGCLALPHATQSLQRLVRLLYPESSSEEYMDAKAVHTLREVWKCQGTTFVSLTVGPKDEETFQVQVKDGAYDILGRNGQRLQHTIRPLPIDAECAAETLIHRLIHLAKYYNVLELKNPNGMSRLSISLTKKPHSFPREPRLAADPHSNSPKNQHYKATENEWLLLRVTNMSGFALNITVLDMDSTWAIEQIYPHGGAAYETLDPRMTLYIPLNVTVPNGIMQSQVLDTIKVFATDQATSFRWLELPELDRETPQCHDSPNRGNALELLQATMVFGGPAARIASPYVSLGWGVEHATIEMRHI
ncbi:caspase domain-containing protein [Xylaria scruposa]|nr:caspase domain-containing protein [Xylaria scruposa]